MKQKCEKREEGKGEERDKRREGRVKGIRQREGF
jgi:hypothetical protein